VLFLQCVHPPPRGSSGYLLTGFRRRRHLVWLRYAHSVSHGLCARGAVVQMRKACRQSVSAWSFHAVMYDSLKFLPIAFCTVDLLCSPSSGDHCFTIAENGRWPWMAGRNDDKRPLKRRFWLNLRLLGILSGFLWWQDRQVRYSYLGLVGIQFYQWEIQSYLSDTKWKTCVSKRRWAWPTWSDDGSGTCGLRTHTYEV
jgi:hypothetical protein